MFNQLQLYTICAKFKKYDTWANRFDTARPLNVAPENKLVHKASTQNDERSGVCLLFRVPNPNKNQTFESPGKEECEIAFLRYNYCIRSESKNDK